MLREPGMMPPSGGAPEAFQLFESQFPNEPAPPHTDIVRVSALLKVRGAKWFDYVVLENGTLVIGERSVGQGHANLALGQKVQAGGQVQVSGGSIIEIDNASGHYLPQGPNARIAALKAFRGHGFQVPDRNYLEKVWNKTTKLWEPIHEDKP